MRAASRERGPWRRVGETERARSSKDRSLPADPLTGAANRRAFFAEAEKELQVRQPLLEAGLSKADVREISRAMGLETADLPAQACLASRIPYGQKITALKLERIARELGLGQVRLRDHDPIARVEFAPAKLPEAVRYAKEIIAAVKAEGYRYVTLDLEGYRTGSLNEELPPR